VLGHSGRNQQRYGGEKKQPGLKSRGDTVEFLNVIPQTAKQERGTQHEQRIGHDRAGDRCLDQRVLARLQCSDGDDQFG